MKPHVLDIKTMQVTNEPEIDLTSRVAQLIKAPVEHVDTIETAGRFSLVAYTPLGQPDPLMIVSHIPMRYDNLFISYFATIHSWGKVNWSFEQHIDFKPEIWWREANGKRLHLLRMIASDTRLSQLERAFVRHHINTAIAQPHLY